MRWRRRRTLPQAGDRRGGDGCRRRDRGVRDGHFLRADRLARQSGGDLSAGSGRKHVGLRGQAAVHSGARSALPVPGISLCRKAAGSAGGRPAGGAVPAVGPRASRRGPSRTRRTAAPLLRAAQTAIDEGPDQRVVAAAPGCHQFHPFHCPAFGVSDCAASRAAISLAVRRAPIVDG